MKVLLINGSPHKEGCTYTALCEVASQLEEQGILTEIFWIGNSLTSGCIACGKCFDKSGKCAINTDKVNEAIEKNNSKLIKKFIFSPYSNSIRN